MLSGCTSTIDHASDKFDASGAKLVEGLKDAIATQSPKVASDLRDATNQAIDHAAVRLNEVLTRTVDTVQQRAESLPATLISKVDQAIASKVDPLIKRLNPVDAEGFKRVKESEGWLAALKDYWAEIIAMLTGTSTLGIVKSFLEKRRRKRAEADRSVHQKALEAITTAVDQSADTEGIKAQVKSILRGRGSVDHECEVRKVIQRARVTRNVADTGT